MDAVDEVSRCECSVSGNFKSTSTRNNTTVLYGILDGSQTITNGILDLSDCVLVWTLNNRERYMVEEVREKEECERGTTT